MNYPNNYGSFTSIKITFNFRHSINTKERASAQGLGCTHVFFMSSLTRSKFTNGILTTLTKPRQPGRYPIKYSLTIHLKTFIFNVILGTSRRVRFPNAIFHSFDYIGFYDYDSSPTDVGGNHLNNLTCDKEK